MDTDRYRFLKQMARQFPSASSAATEIINLKAVLNLPKGTEHFVSDIHGEYDAFNHVLRNASGVVKSYIEQLFGNTILEQEKRRLALLVYYPEESLLHIKAGFDRPEDPCPDTGALNDWYRISLFRLIAICKRASSKYTRAKVRKALPEKFAYIIEELLHEDIGRQYKTDYYNEILQSIIDLNCADDFIIEISYLIQHLAVDHLHVIGDIFDRGKHADKVMEILCAYHSIDIQWGNHDISHMGAALGSEALIANVIRLSAKHNNLHTLEDGYGINLIPLATFAMETYADDPCAAFAPDNTTGLSDTEIALISRMHKAITVIQFKCEARIINNHPEFEMSDMLWFNRIFEPCVREKLSDTFLPTVSEAEPFALTADERDVIQKLRRSFINSDKLQKHVRFLFNKGSMYKVFNSNLLFHGCVPLDVEGRLKYVSIGNMSYAGKDLLDYLEDLVRRGAFLPDGAPEKRFALDLMWYLWCGKDSPLYGKDRMTTFERYFIKRDSADYAELISEPKNHYYSYRDDASVCDRILASFGLDGENAHIINGHVPVRLTGGENPVKASGRLIVIDGGFAKAYYPVTGIAGYTLIFNAHGLCLAAHEPFVSMGEAVASGSEMVTNMRYIERLPQDKNVSDTDTGAEIIQEIEDLKELLHAYRTGLIKELD